MQEEEEEERRKKDYREGGKHMAYPQHSYAT